METRIDLPGDFYLTADAYNYILHSVYPSEAPKSEGKMIDRIVGYYSILNLRGAIEGYLRHYAVVNGRYQGDLFRYIDNLEKALEKATNDVTAMIEGRKV